MTKTVKITWFTVLLLGFIHSVPSTPSFAAEIKVFPNAAPTRYYAPDQKVSDCAGKPTTPQCALDTWWSCVVQEHVDHCEAISIKDMVFRNYTPPPGTEPLPERVIALRPIKIVVVEEGDIPPNSRLSQWLKPGDVEIEYKFDVCEGGKPSDCTWESPGQENVFFRKESSLWHLIAWTSEAGYVVCEDYTPPYGRQCRFWLDDYLYTEYVHTIDPERGAGVRSYKRIDLEPLMQGLK